MGFNFTAFAGGFAKEAVSSIEKEEELAALRGANGTKVLYENYKTVLADNRKLENELKANIETLKAYDPNATEAELLAVATKKPVMDYVTAQIKKENFDPETFKLSNIASIANDNVKSTALDLIRENLRIPKAVSDAENPFAVKKRIIPIIIPTATQATLTFIYFMVIILQREILWLDQHSDQCSDQGSEQG